MRHLVSLRALPGIYPDGMLVRSGKCSGCSMVRFFKHFCVRALHKQRLILINILSIGAKRFNSDISNWDTSTLVDMQWMFFEAESFSGDLSKWNVSKVKNMEEVFYHAYRFNSDLSRWDTSSVINMRFMFYEAPRFNSDISNWDVSKVENFKQMFYGATRFNQDIGKWDLSSGEIYIHVLMLFQSYSRFTNFASAPILLF